MSNSLISVLIVTFGKDDNLNRLLCSLSEQTYPQTEIIIIINPPSCSSQKPNTHHIKFKSISNPENLFYCQSLNKGIKEGSGEFILCLNDDVILERNFMSEALKGFLKDSKVGLVSGKILRPDKMTLDSTGLFLSPMLTAIERGYGQVDKGEFEKEEYIFGVCGAVAFYRREMLEDIKEKEGYFDPDFHIFYEDLDIAWRAQRSGWRGYYIPKAIAYHIRGKTVRKAAGIGKSCARIYLSDDLHFDLIKNRYLTIIKNETFSGFLLHLPAIFFYELTLWSYILICKPRLIKQIILFYKYFKQAFKKRKMNFLFHRR